MTDDGKTRPGSRRRLQTATERDNESAQARRLRAQAAQQFSADEEITGQYFGEELRERRAKRATVERIERIETKHDALADTVGQVKVDTGRMSGQLETLLDLASKAEVERNRRAEMDAAERERQRKHFVAVITALGIAIAGIMAALVHGGCT